MWKDNQSNNNYYYYIALKLNKWVKSKLVPAFFIQIKATTAIMLVQAVKGQNECVCVWISPDYNFKVPVRIGTMARVGCLKKEGSLSNKQACWLWMEADPEQPDWFSEDRGCFCLLNPPPQPTHPQLQQAQPDRASHHNNLTFTPRLYPSSPPQSGRERRGGRGGGGLRAPF